MYLMQVVKPFGSKVYCCHTCIVCKLLNRSTVDYIVAMYPMQVVKPFGSRLFCCFVLHHS